MVTLFACIRKAPFSLFSLFIFLFLFFLFIATVNKKQGERKIERKPHAWVVSMGCSVSSIPVLFLIPEFQVCGSQLMSLEVCIPCSRTPTKWNVLLIFSLHLSLLNSFWKIWNYTLDTTHRSLFPLVVYSMSSYCLINPPLSLGVQERNVVCINIFNRPS